MRQTAFVFDSYAVLAYIYDQAGAGKIGDLLDKARGKASVIIWLNLVNLGEIYYIVARNEDFSSADRMVAVVKSWPVGIVNPDQKNTLTAARIKAVHSLSYADSFAAATALEKEARLLTGDREFKALEHILDIDWIS